MQFDPHYVSGLVSSLQSTTASQQKLSSELASGLRVNVASDDPSAAGEAAMLDAAISHEDTFVQTASTTQSMMQVSDSALGSVVTQLTSALSLAVQGNDGALSSANLKSLSQQLSGIQDEVVSLANTSYQGSYIFSGSKGSAQPFTIDTSTSPATVNYNGDTQTNSVTTPFGQQIQTGLAGSAVFTASGADVMTALSNLIADFSTGTASPTSATDISALQAGLSNVSQQRSTLDSSLSRLESSSTYFQTNETQLKAQQSTLVAADTATVATQLSSVETQGQALMSVITADEKGGLFSYMQG